MERAFISWRPDADSLKRGWRIGGMEVRDTVENLIRNAWANALGIELLTPFEVMTYQHAMSRVSGLYNRLKRLSNPHVFAKVWVGQARY